jgi:hypothetical protein
MASFSAIVKPKRTPGRSCLLAAQRNARLISRTIDQIMTFSGGNNSW